MRRLEGKTAIITGSGRGIGAATAQKLAREGAKIVITDIDGPAAAEMVAALQTEGAEAIGFAGDITANDFGERIVAQALSRFGGIDIIINNAGYIWPQAIHKMTDKQFLALLDVHVTAPFRLLRAAAPAMMEAAKAEAKQGREIFRKVVNISSTLALSGEALSVNYGSAKAAVIGMTKSLAKEWGRYKINVNCVAFALIATRFTDPEVAKNPILQIGAQSVNIGTLGADVPSLLPMIPLGRVGTTEEAAGSIYLLCCPESNYITGHVLVVSGGLH